MIPDASKHCPDPFYLRELVRRSGLSQENCARRVGISPRQMRYHLALGDGRQDAPYPVQFALEVLAGVVSPASRR